jgi:hypothetical protein
MTDLEREYLATRAAFMVAQERLTGLKAMLAHELAASLPRGPGHATSKRAVAIRAKAEELGLTPYAVSKIIEIAA